MQKKYYGSIMVSKTMGVGSTPTFCDLYEEFMKSKEEIEKLIKRLEDKNKELPDCAKGWMHIQRYCNNTAINYLKWVIE